MGFSLKTYEQMKQECTDHLRDFRVLHNKPEDMQLPNHRRPYVLFLNKMMAELDKLPSDPNSSDKLEEDERKAKIFSGVMLILINMLDKGSRLRGYLAVDMGSWGSEKDKDYENKLNTKESVGEYISRVGPSTVIDPQDLTDMLHKTITFYNSLTYEKSEKNEKHKQMRIEHPFSELESKFLDSFYKIGINLWSEAILNAHAITSTEAKHKIEEIKHQLNKEKKEPWYSIFSSGKDKKEEREEPNFALAGLK